MCSSGIDPDSPHPFRAGVGATKKNRVARDNFTPAGWTRGEVRSELAEVGKLVVHRARQLQSVGRFLVRAVGQNGLKL
jgi:hypothetical protein